MVNKLLIENMVTDINKWREFHRNDM